MGVSVNSYYCMAPLCKIELLKAHNSFFVFVSDPDLDSPRESGPGFSSCAVLTLNTLLLQLAFCRSANILL